jgi:hypothetical protein
VLIVTTNRLMLSSPSLVRVLYPATGAARGAALVATVMILRESGDGWQLFAVLLILPLLAEVLAPILERYAASDGAPAERLLGVVGGVEVVAVTAATLGWCRSAAPAPGSTPARVSSCARAREHRASDRATCACRAPNGRAVQRGVRGLRHPFRLDEGALAGMIDSFDLDVDASRVALRDGEPVGFGNLGASRRRGLGRRRRRRHGARRQGSASC